MKDNKTFCILPWIHTHLNTEGDVFPCCISWNSERSARAGWLKDQSLEEIFNNDFMKQLRLDMLNGVKRNDVCSDCYKREENGFKSARIGSNNEHNDDDIDRLVRNTANDGYVEPVIKSWDIRFSNLCNLKCRTCGPLFSTTWAKEENEGYLLLNSVKKNSSDPLEEQYDNVEKIYFAGGEPLIMPEHFSTLNKIIEKNQAYKTKLIYNSNLTKLNYNNNDLVSLWTHFKEVVIGASIDAVGNRAEYIRHGVPWKNIESNLRRLIEFKKECPNFNFYISPTVGILNVFHLTDMHQYLWGNNLIPYINSMQFNMLLFPKHYDCRILPKEIKEQIQNKISNHITWLNQNNANNLIINDFSNLYYYLEDDIDGQKEEMNNFTRITKEIDKRRNENFREIFPEYKSIVI